MKNISCILSVFFFAIFICCDASPAEEASGGGCCSADATGEATSSCCMKGSDGAAAGCCSKGAESADGKTGRPYQKGYSKRGLMRDAMGLIHNHASLTRTVEEIPKGVKTTTTTTDASVLKLLQQHPRDMYEHYEAGGAVRRMDPMFRELSRVADKVDMEFRNLDNGIEVIATSEDKEVVKLIRAHAHKVSDFVKRGHAAVRGHNPLPEGYNPDN